MISFAIPATSTRGRPNSTRSTRAVVRLRPHHGTRYDVSVVAGRESYDVNSGKAYDVNPAINTSPHVLVLSVSSGVALPQHAEFTKELSRRFYFVFGYEVGFRFWLAVY